MSVEVSETLKESVEGGIHETMGLDRETSHSQPTQRSQEPSLLTDRGSLRIWHYLIVGITELYLWILKEWAKKWLS